ncbi:hypothetical protein WA026_010484 [Henosepilachna vigintioctopunctata]|uniref:Uncharacterized protein n=1 Tax=Henosepilachna vigintioctopunctata TaxID=420089 RepID=A0AAW1VBL9_9CUCU
MSLCEEFGKDKVIFATEEDHKIPSTVTLLEPEAEPGLIFPKGDINWNCPCLGEAEPKGSDCYVLLQQYPTLFNKDIADEDDLGGLEEQKGIDLKGPSTIPSEGAKLQGNIDKNIPTGKIDNLA